MTVVADDPLDSYAALLADTDRRFGEIRRRHERRMACGEGCSACCRARLSVAHVEAAAIRRGLEGLPGALRTTLAQRAADPAREYCPALDPQGRCDLYAIRPLICRTIGVPLRHESREPLIQPAVIDICDKNFTDTPARSLPDRDVLNQTERTGQLASIDARFCERAGLSVAERVPLARLLLER